MKKNKIIYYVDHMFSPITTEISYGGQIYHVFK